MTESTDNSNGNGKSHSARDETTPLLAASAAGPTTQSNEEPLLHAQPNGNNTGDDEDNTPLPRAQIFLLCYARIVEPIAFFCIFPFINQMIFDTGKVDQADVGFYSGLIESLFSLTQMILMIPWGRAADRYGRKPVLVFSLAGASIATALFGISTEIWQMILFRCLAGAFAGTVVTVRAMITENSTPKTHARAFSFFAFSSNLGLFLGPLIGGVLSNPADQYPRLFGNIQFFRDYPYALPTFGTGAVGVSACIISALFIKETLKKKPDEGSITLTLTTWEIIKYPGIIPVLLLYGYILLLAFAYTAVVPIFWFTSPELGGFGFTPLQISIFLGGAGISQALWTLFAFPPLQLRFGTGGVLRMCSMAWPMLFTLPAVGNILLRQGLYTAFWIIAPIGTFLGAGCSMAFAAAQLAVNDISPSSSSLGTVNAIALTLVSGERAIAPALFASLFAASVRSRILYGHLIWVLMVLIALGLAVALRWLPKRAEGRAKKVGIDENDEIEA
ncbi:major facilitator superfamily transporter [Phlyctema vagabunda]|uniref:Major facilitator superfamily transporter n=1 Tax=Phlyctema vagabunda TaxID=108571 RepID=A0ABR4PAH6_9HELO